MLTVNGAKALAIDNLGRLKEGFIGDLILIDIKEKTYFYPRHNNLSNLFYAGSGQDVDTVIIDGALVYKDREFLTLDQEEIYYQVEKIRQDKFN